MPIMTAASAFALPAATATAVASMPAPYVVTAFTRADGMVAVTAANTWPPSGENGCFKFSDRFARGMGVRTKTQNAFLGQSLFGDLIKAGAQNHIEWPRRGCIAWGFAQRDMLDIARLGIEKKQMLGIGQMRFNARLKADGNTHGNAKFHNYSLFFKNRLTLDC
jgi:hypothetical protein